MVSINWYRNWRPILILCNSHITWFLCYKMSSIQLLREFVLVVNITLSQCRHHNHVIPNDISSNLGIYQVLGDMYGFKAWSYHIINMSGFPRKSMAFIQGIRYIFREICKAYPLGIPKWVPPMIISCFVHLNFGRYDHQIRLVFQRLEYWLLSQFICMFL